MTYEETIEYLYEQLPVFHRIGAKAFKAGLSNTLALCEYLGNPQNKFKSIHVGGTNGKGSTSHFLSAILQAAGYKTGLYTSPHLKDYSERFRIDGNPIDKAKIISFVEQNKSFLEKLRPSFFEMSVALAFDYFAKEKVDIAVIEVGLGGRLDSTNIITPLLAIITNIGLDHTDILGDTLAKIATEKAGIIKTNIPVIISERAVETDSIFIEKANLVNTPICFAEDDFEIQSKKNVHGKLEVKINNKTFISELGGEYQDKNLCAVLKAVDILRENGFTISDENIEKGFSEVVTMTGLKGRWQILNKEPLTICDTGHNEHGIKILMKQINALKVRQKHFVLGFVRDKDINSVLKLFPKEAIYYFCQANSPRSLPAEDLLLLANSEGLRGYAILSVNEAIKKATENANSNDLIFIGGSTFVVAEIEDL